MPTHDYATKIIEWDDTYRLGEGLDYATGQVRSSVLANSKQTKPESDAGSQRVQSVLRRVTKREDLLDSLTLNLSGNGSVSSPKGQGSGSFSTQFVDSLTIKTYNVNLLLLVEVINSAEHLPDKTVNEKALKHPNFHGVYGDHLITGYKTGGIYMALYEFVTRSEEDKKRVEIALGFSAEGPTIDDTSTNKPNPAAATRTKTEPDKLEDKEAADDENKEAPTDGETDPKPEEKKAADALMPGEAKSTTTAKAAGQVNLVLEKVKTVENVETRVTVRRIGGHGKLPLQDPKALAEHAEQFPDNVRTHGEKIYALVTPYSCLPEMSQMVTSQALVGEFSRCRERLLRQYRRAQSIADNLDFAMDPLYRAGFAESNEQLAATKKQVDDHIEQVMALLVEMDEKGYAFVQLPGYLQRIPEMLDLSLIPRRMGIKPKLAPGEIPSPRALTRLILAILEANSSVVPDGLRRSVEMLGTFVIGFFNALAKAMHLIMWAFRHNKPEAVRVALDKLRRIEKNLQESLRSYRVEYVRNIHEKLEEIKGDARKYDELGMVKVRNCIDELLSRVGGDEARGELHDHFKAAQNVIADLSRIPLEGTENIWSTVSSDVAAFQYRQEEYLVANLVLAGVVAFVDAPDLSRAEGIGRNRRQYIRFEDVDYSHDELKEKLRVDPRDVWSRFKEAILKDLKRNGRRVEANAFDGSFNQGFGPLLDKWRAQMRKAPRYNRANVKEVYDKIVEVQYDYHEKLLVLGKKYQYTAEQFLEMQFLIEQVVQEQAQAAGQALY